MEIVGKIRKQRKTIFMSNQITDPGLVGIQTSVVSFSFVFLIIQKYCCVCLCVFFNSVKILKSTIVLLISLMLLVLGNNVLRTKLSKQINNTDFN